MRLSRFHQSRINASTYLSHRRAPDPRIGLYMHSLAEEQYKGGEHAYNLLTVSMSMSIYKTMRRRGAPRFYKFLARCLDRS
jgi:hypothetical protein